MNAVIDGDEIVYRDYTDISIAVATPKGLVVPVLRNADELSFADVEKARAPGGSLFSRGPPGQDGPISMAGSTCAGQACQLAPARGAAWPPCLVSGLRRQGFGP